MAAKETLVDAVRAMRGRSTGRGRIAGPRSWPIWELPRWVAVFVILVVLTDAVVLAVAASQVRIQGHDLVLFAGLLICSAATVELTRRAGENLGFVKDVYAVWELPVAILLPLAYVPRPSGGPLRPDPVAGPARPGVPARVQRGRHRAELRQPLPWSSGASSTWYPALPPTRPATHWPGCRS